MNHEGQTTMNRRILLGALVDRADDVWKIKKLKPASRDESKKFKLKSPSRGKYVDVETAK